MSGPDSTQLVSSVILAGRSNNADKASAVQTLLYAMNALCYSDGFVSSV